MRRPLPPEIAAAVAVSGEAGACFASFDWESHPLGPVAQWPPALRTVVAVALASRFPVVLWLGDELTMVYNDGYIPMLADKHPWAMGQRGLDVWSEVRDIIEPMLASVVASGVATWSDDLLLPLVDQGRPWEKYFTFTYSPIFGDTGVSGVFCAVTETTERVVGERRMAALDVVGARLVDAQLVDEVIAATIDVCAAHRADAPFVALYLYDDAAADSALVACSPGVSTALATAAPWVTSWAVEAKADEPAVVVAAAPPLAAVTAALGAGAPEAALVLPLADTSAPTPIGALVMGLNPMRPYDEQYRTFCQLLAARVAGGISSARAYEAERRRAEALAELDRAKTAFLTNVSHEFRTPLTLMLGPLEDALEHLDGDGALRAQLESAHRSGRRLLRLVNTLLDFARIEAGRAEVHLAAVDVGALTAELARSFAEVCRRAGLELRIECAAVTGAVDPEMWETVVLNLVSNAFKYTLAGSITVRTGIGVDGGVELSVADTGVGIRPDALERVFERFYRPADVEGRSAEGSGIGLALVRNLVELQGGAVAVSSRLGEGTTFTVTLPPVARARPAADDGALAARRRMDNAYVSEAAQWLEAATGDGADERAPAALQLPARPLVLVADDNADLRAHLERVLGRRWRTVAAVDGRQALELARRLVPDLVIADVMMPHLDGFGLIAALRADPALASMPVLLLSARAGLESADEGFAAGADDYLVKPFRAADLVNRVEARLAVAARERTRRLAGERQVRQASSLAGLATALSSATTHEELVTALVGADLGELRPDAAIVGVLGLEGLLHLSFAGNADPALAARYHTLALDAPVPMAECVRGDHRIVVADTFSLDARYGAVVADTAATIRALVCHPLRAAGGGMLGGLSFCWAEPRRFDPAELAVLEQVAAVVTRALERIETTAREHTLVNALQERLLEWDVRTTRAAVATVYQPAADALRVGGDWYTITALGEPEVLGVSVGDVVGHGLPSTTVMSELRSALGLAALAAREPSRVVDLLDQYAQRVPGAACTTVSFAVVDAASERVRYASAGHPPPVMVDAGGGVSFLDDGRRPPLAVPTAATGAAHGTAAAHGSAAFPAGSLLLLYTDGLVERRGESITEGLDRLAAAAAECAGTSVTGVCTALLSGLAPADGYRDDVALVAVRPVGATPVSFVDVIAAEVREVPALRARLRQWLAALGLGEETVHDVLLSVGETVSNAIEHGSAFDAHQTVTIECFAGDGVLTSTVTDFGHWSGDSARSRREERRGRGLTLMYALSEKVVMARTAHGTSVTLVHRLHA